MPRHWLFKSEPECFSIQDLAARPRQTTCWDGVRNYQARNFLRDDVRLGDQVLFYHSNADPPAIVGLAEVVREAYPDPTAWNPQEQHFDPKASPENPTWQMVDIRLVRVFDAPLGLDRLRGVPGLTAMELLRKGSRLSVQPVSPREFAIVLALAEEGAQAGQQGKRSVHGMPGRAAASSKPRAKTKTAAPRRNNKSTAPGSTRR